MTMWLASAEKLGPGEIESLPEYTGRFMKIGLPADISRLLKPITFMDVIERSIVEIEMDEKLGKWGQRLPGLIEKTHLREFINKRDDDQEIELVTKAIAERLFVMGYELGERLLECDEQSNNHLSVAIVDKLRHERYIDQKRVNLTPEGIQECRNAFSEILLEGAKVKKELMAATGT